MLNLQNAFWRSYPRGRAPAAAHAPKKRKNPSLWGVFTFFGVRSGKNVKFTKCILDVLLRTFWRIFAAFLALAKSQNTVICNVP